MVIEFVNMLNEMRRGHLSPKSIERFKSLSRSIEYKDGLEATELLVQSIILVVFVFTLRTIDSRAEKMWTGLILVACPACILKLKFIKQRMAVVSMTRGKDKKCYPTSWPLRRFRCVLTVK